jgi:hypothetical protein
MVQEHQRQYRACLSYCDIGAVVCFGPRDTTSVVISFGGGIPMPVGRPFGSACVNQANACHQSCGSYLN